MEAAFLCRGFGVPTSQRLLKAQSGSFWIACARSTVWEPCGTDSLWSLKLSRNKGKEGNGCCCYRVLCLKSHLLDVPPSPAVLKLCTPQQLTACHLPSLASKSSKPGCIYLWSWSRSFDTKGKGCQRTVSAVILAELEWSTTDLSYLTLSTCPGRQHPPSAQAARLCQSLQQGQPHCSRFTFNSPLPPCSCRQRAGFHSQTKRAHLACCLCMTRARNMQRCS